jgi:hypothetical protein
MLCLNTPLSAQKGMSQQIISMMVLLSELYRNITKYGMIYLRIQYICSN